MNPFMDGDSRPYWIITGILILLSAVFALMETALSSVSKTRIKVLSERGDLRAEKALYAIEHFDQAITTLLIGTNIVHIAAAALVTSVVTRTWGLGAVSLSTIITTIVVFFTGEMLPKSIAKKNSEKYILQTAGFLCVLMKLLKPFSFVLSRIADTASKHAKAEPEVSVTEEEPEPRQETAPRGQSQGQGQGPGPGSGDTYRPKRPRGQSFWLFYTFHQDL